MNGSAVVLWASTLVALLACGSAAPPQGDAPVTDASTSSVDDSLAGLADGFAYEAEVIPLAVQSARGVVLPDTSPIAATADELRELAARIVMPIPGVRWEDLIDSYSDPRGGRVHEALDIHAPRGTPVVSATDGRVLRLHDSEAGGLMVYAADASSRFILMYGHLDRLADGLADGAPLRSGQVIGYVGTSGNAPPETPHLHFVVARGQPDVSWWRGNPVNPYTLFVPGSHADR